MSSSRKLPIPKHPKERGEWVELVFMAHAARLGLKVAKPHGDSTRYDLITEHQGTLRRVQVKSTLVCEHGRYRCVYYSTAKYRNYTPKDFDFLAAYVIPAETWYLIPSRLIGTSSVLLDPFGKSPRNRYAPYREAWEQLFAPKVVRAAGRPHDSRRGRRSYS